MIQVDFQIISSYENIAAAAAAQKSAWHEATTS